LGGKGKKKNVWGPTWQTGGPSIVSATMVVQAFGREKRKQLACWKIRWGGNFVLTKLFAKKKGEYFRDHHPSVISGWPARNKNQRKNRRNSFIK